jgi:hypothetical protein
VGGLLSTYGSCDHYICIRDDSRWFGGGMVVYRWCWSGLEVDMSPCYITMGLSSFLTEVVS